ncbi:hypothetical protein [Cupriavidus sp. SIMBA_020]|uniref:hypothetical protein n=1 Tax=Cupriavidus sp. SIMBA_020 TaxID=3085766 RepID=UPI00397943F5
MDTSTRTEGRGFDLSLIIGPAKRPEVTLAGVIRNVKADIDGMLVALLGRLEALVEEAAAQQPVEQSANTVIYVEYGRDGKPDADLQILDPRRILANLTRWENWLMTALVKLWQAFDASDGKSALCLAGKTGGVAA